MLSVILATACSGSSSSTSFENTDPPVASNTGSSAVRAQVHRPTRPRDIIPFRRSGGAESGPGRALNAGTRSPGGRTSVLGKGILLRYRWRPTSGTSRAYVPDKQQCSDASGSSSPHWPQRPPPEGARIGRPTLGRVEVLGPRFSDRPSVGRATGPDRPSHNGTAPLRIAFLVRRLRNRHLVVLDGRMSPLPR